MDQNIKPLAGAADAAIAALTSSGGAALTSSGGAAFTALTSATSTVLAFPLLSTSPFIAEKRRHLRRLLPLLTRFVLRIAVLILAPLLAVLSSPRSTACYSASSSSSVPAAARALDHALSLLARVPVASRKYDLLRSLADRLLDDNVAFSCELETLNRAALSNAFSRTLRRLEVAVAAGTGLEGVVRRWVKVEVEEVVAPEKLAAELLWMAGKMGECGAVGEAVARWGEAVELGRMALSADPRLQAAFVRFSVFLFKHVIEENDEVDEDEQGSITHRRMSMLTSWLPLLCRASNGADAPVLNSKEKAEMVKGLQELIRKLSWEHQEEVLALWLHHFTTSPDSDWPNLESCYTQWYAESRKLLLE